MEIEIKGIAIHFSIEEFHILRKLIGEMTPTEMRVHLSKEEAQTMFELYRIMDNAFSSPDEMVHKI